MSDALRNISPASMAGARRQIDPLLAAFAVGALLAGAAIAFLVVYETAALGWPPGREFPPRFDNYHLFRTGLVVLFCLAFLGAVARARAHQSELARMPLGRFPAIAAASLTLLGLGLVALLALDPGEFHDRAREDGMLEWASALLLFAASGIFAERDPRLLKGPQGRLVAGAAALLAAIFFVMAMEEISWFQRVIGFGTPEDFAEANWQGEFNLHNLQTNFSELALHTGAGLFLGVVPLLRDVVPARLLFHPLAAFVPTRAVGAVGAPVAMLTYGQWNLLPVQLACLLATFALLAFSRAAWRRGDRSEARLFAALAFAVALGQALTLAYGGQMADVPDASEYKELFIAAGFAFYAASAARALSSDGSVAARVSRR